MISQTVSSLVKSLSFGRPNVPDASANENVDPIGKIAQVYEIARNALEYRAEHLVKRAAIERILRRQLLFGRSPDDIAELLLQELKWAKYLGQTNTGHRAKDQISQVVEKYRTSLVTITDRNWVIGVMSAEIEEVLNPNPDYHKFTVFAFNTIKQLIEGTDESIDLPLYVAVDRVYAQADDQQAAYHLYKLVNSQAGKKGITEQDKIMQETYKLFYTAINDKRLNSLISFCRKHTAPLVLLRDIYFTYPDEYNLLITDHNLFAEKARYVLTEQLAAMRKRIRTASVRSLVYVFLTKMVLVILLEIPIERFLGSHIEIPALLVNLTFPVIVMAVLTAGIKLPNENNQAELIKRSWEIINQTENDLGEDQILNLDKIGRKSRLTNVFYMFYILLFAAIFAMIVSVLRWIGFNPVSIVIFVFFLSVVSFFAFRIKRTAEIYSYQPNKKYFGSISETLMLPIIVAGSKLSAEVGRLNFLVFILDFVMEAPFKMILRFMDSWLAFLSKKKDEAIG